MIKNEAHKGLVFLLLFYRSIEKGAGDYNPETWTANSIKITGKTKISLTEESGSIVISDENTGYKTKPLSNYPINWSVVQGTLNFCCFGTIISEDTAERKEYFYPAVRAFGMENRDESTVSEIGDIYYFNGSTWARYTGANKFYPLGNYSF